MPKMKVLETGQASDEVVIMSWSPKMDLLALGNAKGNVQLHRLSWQKVWQVPLTFRGEPSIPELMTWHPEGLFLVISSGCCTFVIDVECGKVVHNHELPVAITSVRWCTSLYRHTMNDVLFTQSKQQADYLRSDLKIQRMETNLSILFLGTVNGYVYAYTGGFLLGFCIHLYEEGSSCQILQMDASPSLEVFQFLSDEEAGNDDMVLSFSLFRNEYLPRIAPIIGPLGLKYILFLKNWAMIQSEISSLNEHWARLVDLYNMYMTFSNSKNLQMVRLDYLELLLTGMTCVEMELFLGDSGREKEAKKSTNAVNTANASITEHLRTIKCSIVNLLTELNEIGGFLKQISGYDEANKLMTELRKSCNYLFLAVLHIQALVHNFVEVLLHFMHLIMNTIHSFNVQEVPDFIEEDADTDKVLEFLDTNVDKDIFQFLMKNVSLGYQPSGTKLKTKRRTIFAQTKIPETNAIGVPSSESATRDFARVPEIIAGFLEKQPATAGKHSMLMDFSEKEAKEFLSNVIPTLNKLTKNLLSIPVLCSVPFEADTHQITRLPKSQYLDISFESDSDESAEQPSPFHKRSFQMTLDPLSDKALISSLWTDYKLLFFEIDFADMCKINVKAMTLNLSRSMCDSKLFSDSYVTLVTYEENSSKEELQEASCTILCQVQYRNLLNKVASIDLASLKSKCGAKSTLPVGIPVEIPNDLIKGTAPLTNPNVDYALPIEGFAPYLLEVSGPRKVGALLADNRRTVLLLEMETDLSETSYDDDTADASDSEESEGNNNADEEY